MHTNYRSVDSAVNTVPLMTVAAAASNGSIDFSKTALLIRDVSALVMNFFIISSTQIKLYFHQKVISST